MWRHFYAAVKLNHSDHSDANALAAQFSNEASTYIFPTLGPGKFGPRARCTHTRTVSFINLTRSGAGLLKMAWGKLFFFRTSCAAIPTRMEERKLHRFCVGWDVSSMRKEKVRGRENFSEDLLF